MKTTMGAALVEAGFQPRLTRAEAEAKDAAQRAWLNRLRIAQVHRASGENHECDG